MSEFDPSRRRLLLKLGAEILGYGLAGTGAGLAVIATAKEAQKPDKKAENIVWPLDLGISLAIGGLLLSSRFRVSRWQDPKR